MKKISKNILGWVIISSLFVGYVAYNIYVTSEKEEAYQAVKIGVVDLNNKYHVEALKTKMWGDKQEEMYDAVKYGLSRNKDAYAREHYVVTKKDAQEIEEMIATAQNKDLNSTNDVNSTHVYHTAHKKVQNAD